MLDYATRCRFAFEEGTMRGTGEATQASNGHGIATALINPTEGLATYDKIDNSTAVHCSPVPVDLWMGAREDKNANTPR